MIYQSQKFIIDALQKNHILIAGATGSGKSILIKSLLYNLVANGIQFDIIDLKKISLIEFFDLQKCRQRFYADNIQTVEKVLKNAVNIMNIRYNEMKAHRTDKTSREPFYIVVDEAADLLTTYPCIKPLIVKLLRLGRAANIRLIFATQSPDRKTIDAHIQQNITSVFALRCRSSVESRQVIGISGAEKLPLYGYCLYLTDGMRTPERLKINMIPDKDLKELINYRIETLTKF